MSASKRRSDYGIVRATPRDLALLRWAADQFAVNTEQLKILMNRWKRSHEPQWGGESLSDETIRWQIKRWRRAGWVESRTLLAGEPPWVWLSKGGLEALGLDYPAYEPAVGRLSHIYHVNSVRLYIEKRLGDEVRWISERQINTERKEQGKRHLVDGEAIYQGRVIGVEVEQTQKSRRRLASIVRELRRDYSAVWYFVADAALEAVRDEIARLEGSADQAAWETFVIYPLAKAAAQRGLSSRLLFLLS